MPQSRRERSWPNRRDMRICVFLMGREGGEGGREGGKEGRGEGGREGGTRGGREGRRDEGREGGCMWMGGIGRCKV